MAQLRGSWIHKLSFPNMLPHPWHTNQQKKAVQPPSRATRFGALHLPPGSRALLQFPSSMPPTEPKEKGAGLTPRQAELSLLRRPFSTTLGWAPASQALHTASLEASGGWGMNLGIFLKADQKGWCIEVLPFRMENSQDFSSALSMPNDRATYSEHSKRLASIKHSDSSVCPSLWPCFALGPQAMSLRRLVREESALHDDKGEKQQPRLPTEAMREGTGPWDPATGAPASSAAAHRCGS